MAFIHALTIGVDIGGTKVAAGVVDPEGNVLERLRADTPSSSPQATEDTIADVVAELRDPARGDGRRNRSGRLDRRHADPRCCSHRTWPGGTSPCGTPFAAGSGCP